MRVLAIIPARGGSKGIPKKNIVKINNIPLIGYTIDAALASRYLTDVVVSTDDHEIAKISKKLGANVPFIRPELLALDDTESAPVIEHALLFMERSKNITYDAVLMLQPTSPLRTSKHIEDSIELFKSNKCDSVVSVVSVGGNHPFRMKRLVGKQLINFIDQGFWDMRPRQSLPNVYIRNGAIYLINRDTFIQRQQLIGEACLGYVMNDYDSVNIDTFIDLKIAEILLEEKNDHKNIVS
jgi:CMP-N-acetylneuraminic acid synthetase